MKTAMQPTTHEAVAKAVRSAEALAADILAAHRLACEGDPMLEILLRDLIGEARKLEQRLKEIESAAR